MTCFKYGDCYEVVKAYLLDMNWVTIAVLCVIVAICWLGLSVRKELARLAKGRGESGGSVAKGAPKMDIHKFMEVVFDNKVREGISTAWEHSRMCSSCKALDRTHKEIMTRICLSCGDARAGFPDVAYRKIYVNGVTVIQVNTTASDNCLLSGKPLKGLKAYDILDIINEVI